MTQYEDGSGFVSCSSKRLTASLYLKSLGSEVLLCDFSVSVEVIPFNPLATREGRVEAGGVTEEG